MLLFNLVFAIAISQAREMSPLSFSDKPLVVCGREIQWIQLLPTLSETEANCLNEESPLKLSEVKEPFGREQLARLLRNAHGLCLGKYELIIPEKIYFKSSSFLGAETLNEWIYSQLRQQLNEEQLGADLEISSLQLPKIDCSSIQRISLAKVQMEGRNGFRINLSADGKNYGFTGEYRLFRRLPVLTRALNANEKVASSDIEEQRKDITFSPGYVGRREDLLGRVLSYPVLKGEAVQLRFLKPEFMIEKGQIIQLQFNGDNFLLTANAAAEQSGVQGDLIKVKAMESQKILSGIIIGKGLVEVH